jgi:uncharacterized protein YegP (UPF0339 family)
MGTFDYKKKNEEFQFVLKAGNGGYFAVKATTKAACLNGIESVKKIRK